MSHFSPEKRGITEVINCPFTVIYSDLVAAMHPDDFLGSLEPSGASFKQAVNGWIFLTVKSELFRNTLNSTVRVSFVLSLIGIPLSLYIFPV